jgi:hypothetical protein
MSNENIETLYGNNFLDITNCLIEVANTNNPKIRELERLKDELSKTNQKRWAGIFTNPAYKTKQSEIERLRKELNSKACEIARGKYKEDETDMYEPYPDDYGFSFEIDHSRIQGLKGVLRDSPKILVYSPLIETELELEFYKHRADPLEKLRKSVHDIRISERHGKDFNMVIFSSPENVFDSNGKTSKTGLSTGFSVVVEYPQKSPGLLNAHMRCYIAGDNNRITLPKEYSEEIRTLVNVVSNSLIESAR